MSTWEVGYMGSTPSVPGPRCASWCAVLLQEWGWTVAAGHGEVVAQSSSSARKQLSFLCVFFKALVVRKGAISPVLLTFIEQSKCNLQL